MEEYDEYNAKEFIRKEILCGNLWGFQERRQMI